LVELAEPLLVEARQNASFRLKVVAVDHLVLASRYRAAAKGALHVPRAIAFLPKDVTSEERQLLRGGSSLGHLDEHGRIISRGFNFALHLVYASNTTRAMHGTEVRQAPGRFRCGITTVSALKVSRTSLTKIIGPEPLRDNQFCGPESPPVRAGLISGSPRPYSLARKIKKSLQLYIFMFFFIKKSSCSS
jgi:hypothetical protein